MEFPKRYDPKESEKRWAEYWEKNKIYSFDPDDIKREIYSIDTPPPTVSGRMHMGHAFGNSQQDFIARFKRMNNFNVLQPFGTDDNGLPTQLFIEKTKKVSAVKMGREDFVKLCLDTLENESRPEFLQDWKDLGISCDFNVSYTTINDHCRKISQKSFIDLYKMDRAYRKEAPAMWCPKCHTAVSQVELEDEEQDSMFNDIIFRCDDEDLIIATTRPELLPACVCLFYHPEDDRYKDFKGRKAKVPLFNFEVEIMEDERVDPEKGSGMVMCCTFGDQTDIEWQKQYNLPIKTAISSSGKMTDLAEKYEGMKVKDARKQIIEDMKEKELLVQQKPIKHFVNVHERCGHEIEFVHSKQWFIRYLDLKEKMLDWGNELKWHPEHMKNRYDNWVNGLSWDWCISRQIYFGIPFPVWYCEKCNTVIVADETQLPVDPLKDKPLIEKCPRCGSTEFIGEKDIINTWATSSLSPTIVKELFKDKPVYEKLVNNPMNLRPQGHDIISFWLFNTVVKSQLHYDMNPWKNCFINGWILDPAGKKMSKSKGNIIPPQGMIEKYSADALRYMSSGCKLGDDLPFPEKELVAGTRFINKLWNASKFSLMLLDKNNYENKGKPKHLEAVDRWLLSKLNKVIKESTDFFNDYRFFKAKKAVEDFFWKDFCDYYLEIIKDKLYNPESYKEEQVLSGLYTLDFAMNSLLKMFAPFTPFVTEEIYHIYYAEKEKKRSIHINDWPSYDEKMFDDNVEEVGEFIVKVIGEVRKQKSEKGLALNAEVKKLNIGGTISEDSFEEIKHDLIAATKSKIVEYTQEDEMDEEFELEVLFEL